ncbi:MAG: exodeoxyribonuclease VII small subunit [Bacillota bacterium]|nr:exodeoxyribonuclease VII small subunit [Bacillota bacterium]
MAKAKKDFDTMIEELEGIISRMEKGSLSLEECLKEYKAARVLVSACREKLSAARETLGSEKDPEKEQEDADA